MAIYGIFYFVDNECAARELKHFLMGILSNVTVSNFLRP